MQSILPVSALTRLALCTGLLLAGPSPLAGDAITVYTQYLDDVQATVARAVRDNVSLDEFVSAAKVPEKFRIAVPLIPLMTGFHRWNLQRAFRKPAATPRSPGTSSAR